MAETMRAWVFRSSGHPSKVLKLEQDWPKPTPSGTRILVRVKAAALNPVGYKAMVLPGLRWMQKKPAVPEHDLAGIIEGGDLSGTDLKVGDEVIGFVPADSTMKSGQGVLAEYTLVEKNLLTKKPDNVKFTEAATFPLTTFTSYWALKRVAGLAKSSGQRVFINGGSGGVGVYAVQLAKAYGAYVVTTCSPPSRKLVESLSPDDILDYKESDLVEQLATKYGDKPFDIVFDTVGHNSDLYYKSPKFLKKDGHFVDIAGPHFESTFTSILGAGIDLINRNLRPAFLGGVPRKYKFGMMKPAEGELDEMAQFIREGKLKAIVDEVFPFEKALAAYDRQMSNRAKGKVVVSFTGDA
ncbi:hypothetical protein NBRC10512_006950 [Rhodotorula toruloides]|uniref:RHTO0S13e04698g1_1 n=2 Tax=Rhodotorula toruloides TaxID=5286 RepID=A0A061BAQ0_RHOTO|nr:zinc alcohol dehydrogenase [Rhodotorula toruloides NP11]EMS22382.1 zinc alcohol dehydrogenase [Rhodotorula toruloides NP11]CDR47012.1 RHTO0S13e04698g1_1 [Rhodotorula toruloides]